MLYSSVTAPLAVALSAVGVAAELSKPALWSNLDFIHSAMNSLPAPASVGKVTWSAGQLSKGCRDRALADGKNPNNFQQYSLFLGDCNLPWYICQEKGASPGIDNVMYAFARVPVRMRQWTRNVVHYIQSGGAYAYGSEIVFFGGSAHTSTMLHEVMHTVDWPGGLFSMKSDSQEWADAYNQDSAVPDNYARTNQIENLAQFPGLIIYDRYTGNLARQGDIPRIGHQLQKVSDQCDWAGTYGGRILDIASTGISCTRRWNNDITVRADNGNPVKRQEGVPIKEYEAPPAPAGFRFNSNNAEMVIVPYPEDQTFVETNCTIH